MTIQYRPRGQCSPCKIRTAVSPRIAVLPCLVLPCPPQLSGSPYLLAPSLSISLSYLPFIFLPSPSSFPRVLFPFIFLSLPRRSPSLSITTLLCSLHVWLSVIHTSASWIFLPGTESLDQPPPTLLPLLLLAVPVLLKKVTDPVIHHLSSSVFEFYRLHVVVSHHPLLSGSRRQPLDRPAITTPTRDSPSRPSPFDPFRLQSLLRESRI